MSEAGMRKRWRIQDLTAEQEAIIKKKLKIELSLYTILQIFSITLFEKKPILQVLTNTDYQNQITNSHIQLKLFSI